MALVWCGIVAARPVALPCPTGGHGAHTQASGAPLPPAATASAPSASHGAHDAHAGHRPAAAPSSISEQPDATPHGPTHDAPAHTCDCLGHCCATAVLPLHVFPISHVASAAIDRPTFIVSRSGFVPEWIDFVLPFAIAPPVSART
jgi:hypothetical protein